MSPNLDSCPDCGGSGRVSTVVRLGSGSRVEPDARCGFCRGDGRVHADRIWMRQRGEACAEARRARGETVRQAARRLDISPAHLAAMEAGNVDPAPLERRR